MPSEDTQFKPGQGGRPPGVPNRFTKTVKETVLAVFKEAQDDPELCLMAFLRKHPKDFYLISAKLIPTEVKAEVTMPEGIKIIYGIDPNCRPIGTDPEGDAGILGEQGCL